MPSNASYITSYQPLMSSHYCTYDITASIYETTSSMWGHIYTIHVTSQPLICVITLTLVITSHILCMTSDSDNVWHLLHYTRHHILPLWHQATLFMTSQTLYLTSYPLYLCHHITCMDVITPTDFWDRICYIWCHHIHCIWHHSHWICVITPTLSTLLHPLYVGDDTHSIYNIIYSL